MIAFSKIQGCGNDFVVVDAASLPSADWPTLAKGLCDRRRGIGADGLISLDRLQPAVYAMRMWNPDGSESAMCGNGTRCAGRYLADQEFAHGQVTLHLLDREVVVTREPGETFQVAMGLPSLDRTPLSLEGYTGYYAELSNPHVVIQVDCVAGFPLEVIGPKIEHDPRFEDRTNVHIFEQTGPSSLKMRSWERGAGLTLACGSGACCTAAVAHAIFGMPADLQVAVPGGQLQIRIDAQGAISMRGPAEIAFTGVWP